MKLDEVNALLAELGWRPDPTCKLTVSEKKRVLREMLEKLPHVDLGAGKQQNGHRNLSKENKEELKQMCVDLRIPLTGNETKPQLTLKIKGKQTPPRVAPADETLADFGKYRGRTYEWIWDNDMSYCLWATDTVIEEGEKCSPALKMLAEYIENRQHQQTRATPEGASASGSAASATSPCRPSAPRVPDENPDIEKLLQQVDELRSQISSRRRKTATRDADMKDLDT